MRGSLPVTRARISLAQSGLRSDIAFEMPQPHAVSALVETPLPAAVSALVKTSQPIAFAHWLASDLFRPGPAKEFEPRPVQRGRGGLSEPGPRNAAEADGRETLPGMIEPPTGDIRVQTPGRNVCPWPIVNGRARINC